MDTERPVGRSTSEFEKTSDSGFRNRWLKALFAAAGIHSLAVALLVAPDLRRKEPFFLRLTSSSRVEIRSLGESGGAIPQTKGKARSSKESANSPTAKAPAQSGASAVPAQILPRPVGDPLNDSSGGSATLIGGGSPEYPVISRRMGEEGEVRLLLRIDAEGRVTEASVERSSGFSAWIERRWSSFGRLVSVSSVQFTSPFKRKCRSSLG